jgi:hypothetical protein
MIVVSYNAAVILSSSHCYCRLTTNLEDEEDATQKEALPEVSTEKHYQVNINLKPLFTPGAQGKQLFMSFSRGEDSHA